MKMNYLFKQVDILRTVNCANTLGSGWGLQNSKRIENYEQMVKNLKKKGGVKKRGKTILTRQYCSE